jgi:hypothetical protein
MDPTVTAAAIGVAGTVVVGVAGFGAAIWNTRRTISAASDTRIWDERAKTYVATIAAIGFRTQKREHDTRTIPLSAEAQAQADAYFARYVEPDWFELDGRLYAFGSEDVINAVRRAGAAHAAAMSVYLTSAATEQRQPGSREAIDQWNVTVELLRAANEADEAATVLLSAQLQGKRPVEHRRGLMPPNPQSPGGNRDSEANVRAVTHSENSRSVTCADLGKTGSYGAWRKRRHGRRVTAPFLLKFRPLRDRRPASCEVSHAA